MQWCGIWECKNWQDGTTIWIHVWLRLTSTGSLGFKLETYIFETWGKCLPLPKEKSECVN